MLENNGVYCLFEKYVDNFGKYVAKKWHIPSAVANNGIDKWRKWEFEASNYINACFSYKVIFSALTTQ